jgi:glyceraldehyde 3-phosphate dehydrogenase
MARIAINGFGRIGRLFFRQAFGRTEFEIVAVNDLGNLENLAYLLSRDTVYGKYEKEVRSEQLSAEGGSASGGDVGGDLIVDGKTVKVLQIKDPAQLPWRDLAVDIVVESTGVFDSYEKAKVHLDAGAKRVVITAPAKDPDGSLGKTVLVGVNEGELKAVELSSNASCTTNAASPVVEVLRENPGIEKAVLNTVHAYTATQSIVDAPVKGKDVLRGRAAGQNIVPSSTGAATATTRAIPELQGKFDGIAMRVPVVVGSVADITFIAKRTVTVEEINDILRQAAASERWGGILKVSDEPLVSTDIIGEPFGAIVDASFTRVVGGNLVKILAWYDNEAGYVATLVRHVLEVAKLLSRDP